MIPSSGRLVIQNPQTHLVLKSPQVLLVKVRTYIYIYIRTGGETHHQCTYVGISNAVGLAAAEAHLAANYNRPDYPIFNNYTYTILGDGCLQEGVAAEAVSLAG